MAPKFVTVWLTRSDGREDHRLVGDPSQKGICTAIDVLLAALHPPAGVLLLRVEATFEDGDLGLVAPDDNLTPMEIASVWWGQIIEYRSEQPAL